MTTTSRTARCRWLFGGLQQQLAFLTLIVFHKFSPFSDHTGISPENCSFFFSVAHCQKVYLLTVLRISMPSSFLEQNLEKMSKVRSGNNRSGSKAGHCQKVHLLTVMFFFSPPETPYDVYKNVASFYCFQSTCIHKEAGRLQVPPAQRQTSYSSPTRKAV
jgi:hypothetical protein